MSTTKEKIAVMQAFDEGKLVEHKAVDRIWRCATVPTWSWNEHEYRVKPEPRTWFVVK